MPQPITVRMWVIDGKHPQFSVQYAQAREAQADHYFDEMFEIADDGSNDWRERNRRGETVLEENHEVVNRSRLRVDTRKWALARMSPKKYGERTEIDHSGTIHVVYPPDWVSFRDDQRLRHDTKGHALPAPPDAIQDAGLGAGEVARPVA